MRKSLSLTPIATILATAALLAGALGGVAASPAGASSKSESTYYLALGDSLAAYDPGYPERLFHLVRDDYNDLHLQILACSGESTRTMINGKFHFCGVQESQLDRAVAFLDDHQGQVAFITIDIGANDIVFPLVGGTCVDPDTHVVDRQCVADRLPEIQANLTYILETLQAAAPGVPIIGMPYYDPGLGDWVLWVNGKALVRHNHPINVVFDAALVDTFQEEGVIVADVRGPDAFDTENFIDKVWTDRFGLIPLNVANACRLTLYCATEGLDGHPNDDGFWVIAEAFEDVLPD